MSDDGARAVLILELISAQAKLLADEMKRAKLWEGDYERRVSELSERIRELPRSLR